MSLLVTELNISEIYYLSYPLYRLPEDFAESSEYDNTVLVYRNEIVDDKSINYPDIGSRRLHMLERNYNLPIKPLKTILIPSFNAFLGIIAFKSTKLKVFMDSKGKVFSYKKTFFANVHYVRLEATEYRKTYSLVKGKQLFTPFIVNSGPTNPDCFLIIMYVNNAPWRVIGYSDGAGKSYRVKI